MQVHVVYSLVLRNLQRDEKIRFCCKQVCCFVLMSPHSLTTWERPPFTEEYSCRFFSGSGTPRQDGSRPLQIARVSRLCAGVSI
jgi:hypothetical protein